MIPTKDSERVPLVADGGEPVRRFCPDDNYVAGGSNYLSPIDDHCRLAGDHYASFGVGMLMQSRAFPWRQVAQEEGDAGTVRLAFELDCGD